MWNQTTIHSICIWDDWILQFWLQTVLTRMDKITKVEYLYDPIICGWELINELWGSGNYDTPIHKTPQQDGIKGIILILTPEGHAFRLFFNFNGQCYFPFGWSQLIELEAYIHQVFGHHRHMPTCLDANLPDKHAFLRYNVAPCNPSKVSHLKNSCILNAKHN